MISKYEPIGPETNVLSNPSAMEILEQAKRQLESIGLRCWLGPNGGTVPSKTMQVSLHVSVNEDGLTDCVVAPLFASHTAQTVEGERRYQQVRAQYTADLFDLQLGENPTPS